MTWPFKNKEKKPTWELITDIPDWVIDAIEKIRKRHGGTSSSLRDREWRLKGEHYRYKIAFEGQGGYTVYVWRKPRHSKVATLAT